MILGVPLAATLYKLSFNVLEKKEAEQGIAPPEDKKPKKVVSVADTTQKLTYKYDKRSKQLSIGLAEGINTPDFVIEVVR